MKKSSDTKNRSPIDWWSRTLSIIAIIVALVSLGMTCFDKFYPPEVDILGIKPIFVSNPRNDLKFKDGHTPIEHSVYFIVHLKGKSKPIYVSALDFNGKLHINCNVYSSSLPVENKSIMVISEEFEARKPYFQISWIANLKESNVPIKVNAFEERFICFVLLDQLISGRRKSGYTLPRIDYLGYADGSKTPKRKYSYPSSRDIFDFQPGKDWPNNLRDDFKNGNLNVSIRAGTNDLNIPVNAFKPARFMKQKEWEETAMEKIFYGGDVKIK